MHLPSQCPPTTTRRLRRGSHHRFWHQSRMKRTSTITRHSSRPWQLLSVIWRMSPTKSGASDDSPNIWAPNSPSPHEMWKLSPWWSKQQRLSCIHIVIRARLCFLPSRQATTLNFSNCITDIPFDMLKLLWLPRISCRICTPWWKAFCFVFIGTNLLEEVYRHTRNNCYHSLTCLQE